MSMINESRESTIAYLIGKEREERVYIQVPGPKKRSGIYPINIVPFDDWKTRRYRRSDYFSEYRIVLKDDEEILERISDTAEVLSLKQGCRMVLPPIEEEDLQTIFERQIRDCIIHRKPFASSF